jgi:hypothetical protein
MFAQPRPKKSILPPPVKRRKTEHTVEEIAFDNDARLEYLTGFRKRKLQRIKRAKEEAEKKAKEEKRELRKQVCLVVVVLKCGGRGRGRWRTTNGRVKGLHRRCPLVRSFKRDIHSMCRPSELTPKL